MDTRSEAEICLHFKVATGLTVHFSRAIWHVMLHGHVLRMCCVQCWRLRLVTHTAAAPLFLSNIGLRSRPARIVGSMIRFWIAVCALGTPVIATREMGCVHSWKREKLSGSIGSVVSTCKCLDTQEGTDRSENSCHNQSVVWSKLRNSGSIIEIGLIVHV